MTENELKPVLKMDWIIANVLEPLHVDSLLRLKALIEIEVNKRMIKEIHRTKRQRNALYGRPDDTGNQKGASEEN